MKSIFLKLIVFVGIISLASCMGKQNQAPSKGMNLDSERIYGVGTEPRQLPTKYPADDDGSVADRIANIQEKLYPTTQTTETPVIVAEADSTAGDGN